MALFYALIKNDYSFLSDWITLNVKVFIFTGIPIKLPKEIVIS